MNSLRPRTSLGARARIFGGAVAFAVGAAALGGCASTTSSTLGEPLTAVAPALVLVQPGQQFTAAEQQAALHEGDFVLSGAGNSMQPLFPPGTAVVVHPTSYFMLRAGMAVVYVNRRGTQVAHLLIEQGERGWFARGVNNADVDDDVVTPRNLVGVIKHAYVANVTLTGDRLASIGPETKGFGSGTLLH